MDGWEWDAAKAESLALAQASPADELLTSFRTLAKAATQVVPREGGCQTASRGDLVQSLAKVCSMALK